jgi:hypothetical protein
VISAAFGERAPEKGSDYLATASFVDLDLLLESGGDQRATFKPMPRHRLKAQEEDRQNV